MSLVSLQAVEAKTFGLVHHLGQAQGGLPGQHATPVHADVHFDQNADGDSRPAGRLIEFSDVLDRIDGAADRRPLVQLGQASGLAGSDHLVGDEDILDPAGHEFLGL